MADVTDFSVFAGNLAVYFQGDSDPIEFTRSLFAHIYKGSINETDPFVDDLEKRALKGYFYGEHDITTVAKHIAKDLDLGVFAESVKLDAEDSITELCNIFSETCPDITETTYGMVLAERFQTIINEAAKAKRKRKKKDSQPPIAVDTHPPVPVEIQPLGVSPQDKHGFYLVAEEGSVCPNDGCTHTLFTNENGHLGLLYEVVAIDPKESADDPNNLIALCPECAAKYKAFPMPLSIYRMKEIKKQFQMETADEELLSEQKIQEGVRRIVGKVPQLHPMGPVDLNYNPVMLRQKIEPQNVTLYLKAQAHVNYYFNIVHETLQQMSREGQLRFKPFCEQVKMQYLGMKENGRSQPYIYRKLTDWLQQGTNEERENCEVLISYFIQKCEVFDVITE